MDEVCTASRNAKNKLMEKHYEAVRNCNKKKINVLV